MGQCQYHHSSSTSLSRDSTESHPPIFLRVFLAPIWPIQRPFKALWLPAQDAMGCSGSTIRGMGSDEEAGMQRVGPGFLRSHLGRGAPQRVGDNILLCECTVSTVQSPKAPLQPTSAPLPQQPPEERRLEGMPWPVGREGVLGGGKKGDQIPILESDHVQREQARRPPPLRRADG